MNLDAYATTSVGATSSSMDVGSVLIVDDDPDLLVIAKLAMSRIGGWTVACASSGLEALDVARRVKPDVVLLDVDMGGLDGLATLERMRESEGLAAIPVILVTAHPSDRVLKVVKSGSASGVIAKPFDPAVLSERVLEILALV